MVHTHVLGSSASSPATSQVERFKYLLNYASQQKVFCDDPIVCVAVFKIHFWFIFFQYLNFLSNFDIISFLIRKIVFFKNKEEVHLFDINNLLVFSQLWENFVLSIFLTIFLN